MALYIVLEALTYTNTRDIEELENTAVNKHIFKILVLPCVTQFF